MDGTTVRRVIGAGLVAAAAVVGMAVPAVAAPAECTVLGTTNPDAIKGSYLVRIKDSESPRSRVGTTARELTDEYGGRVVSAWSAALNGFSVRMSAAEARQLAADPAVQSVEQDAVVDLAATQTTPPSWGLDRIDQRALPLSTSYSYDSTAANVRAYVLDTGIRTTHADFGGRATWGYNAIGDGKNTDCNGHGTHVAGTIGGSQYGVAKNVSLVAVKVLSCSGSGTWSQIVDGVNWVTKNAVKPAVANMSLGGSGSSSTLESAVRSSIASGVTYAIASGNSTSDGCNFTPARVAEAITVNATDSADVQASFSNYGTCTDIYAPGVGITSAWYTADNATNKISGTSMATPHVAGAVALYLSANPAATPAQVQSALIANSTTGKVTKVTSGTPNRLLYVGTAAATPVAAPVVTNPGTRGGTVGSPLTYQLAATGGTAPYTWKATGLPAGLTITTAGLVQGTPNTAGTYSVTATVTDAAARTASATFQWNISAAARTALCNPVTNGTDVTVRDLSSASSTLTVTNCTGYASSTARVEVHVKHTYRGELVLDLISPTGKAYRLLSLSGGSTDNIDTIFTGNLSTQVANGTWTLRVQDTKVRDTGYIDSWSLTL